MSVVVKNFTVNTSTPEPTVTVKHTSTPNGSIRTPQDTNHGMKSMATGLLSEGIDYLGVLHQQVWACRSSVVLGRSSSLRRCPTETDRAPATEIADRAGRSVGAASWQASGEGPNFGYRVQVLRLPCAFCGYRVHSP